MTSQQPHALPNNVAQSTNFAANVARMVRAERDFRISLNAVVDGVRRSSNQQQLEKLQSLLDKCTQSIEVNYDTMRKVRVYHHALVQDGAGGNSQSSATLQGATSPAHQQTHDKMRPRKQQQQQQQLQQQQQQHHPIDGSAVSASAEKPPRAPLFSAAEDKVLEHAFVVLEAWKCFEGPATGHVASAPQPMKHLWSTLVRVYLPDRRKEYKIGQSVRNRCRSLLQKVRRPRSLLQDLEYEYITTWLNSSPGPEERLVPFVAPPTFSSSSSQASLSTVTVMNSGSHLLDSHAKVTSNRQLHKGAQPVNASTKQKNGNAASTSGVKGSTSSASGAAASSNAVGAPHAMRSEIAQLRQQRYHSNFDRYTVMEKQPSAGLDTSVFASATRTGDSQAEDNHIEHRRTEVPENVGPPVGMDIDDGNAEDTESEGFAAADGKKSRKRKASDGEVADARPSHPRVLRDAITHGRSERDRNTEEVRTDELKMPQTSGSASRQPEGDTIMSDDQPETRSAAFQTEEVKADEAIEDKTSGTASLIYSADSPENIIAIIQSETIKSSSANSNSSAPSSTVAGPHASQSAPSGEQEQSRPRSGSVSQDLQEEEQNAVETITLSPDASGVYPFAGTKWWDGKQTKCVFNKFATLALQQASNADVCVQMACQSSWFSEDGFLNGSIPGAVEVDDVKVGTPRYQVLKSILKGVNKSNWCDETCTMVAYLYIMHPLLRAKRSGRELLAAMKDLPESIRPVVHGDISLDVRMDVRSDTRRA
jgi:hypothetical protein